MPPPKPAKAHKLDIFETLQAIDEIERLRAALRGVLNADGVTDEIAKLARDALAGEKTND